MRSTRYSLKTGKLAVPRYLGGRLAAKSVLQMHEIGLQRQYEAIKQMSKEITKLKVRVDYLTYTMELENEHN